MKRLWKKFIFEHTPTVLEPGKAKALDSRETIVVLLTEALMTGATAFKQSIALTSIANEMMFNDFIFLRETSTVTIETSDCNVYVSKKYHFRTSTLTELIRFFIVVGVVYSRQVICYLRSFIPCLQLVTLRSKLGLARPWRMVIYLEIVRHAYADAV